MGTGRRRNLNQNNEYYKEEEVQGYCLFCNNSIYVKGVSYCNTFCNNADLYGTQNALMLWTNDDNNNN